MNRSRYVHKSRRVKASSYVPGPVVPPCDAGKTAAAGETIAAEECEAQLQAGDASRR